MKYGMENPRSQSTIAKSFTQILNHRRNYEICFMVTTRHHEVFWTPYQGRIMPTSLTELLKSTRTSESNMKLHLAVTQNVSFLEQTHTHNILLLLGPITGVAALHSLTIAVYHLIIALPGLFIALCILITIVYKGQAAPQRALCTGPEVPKGAVAHSGSGGKPLKTTRTIKCCELVN